MADYKYLGLTAYIRGVDHKEVGVLLEAIDALQGCVEVKDFDLDDYAEVVMTDAYEQVYNESNVSFIDESELPMNTPEAYKKPVIEPVVVREVKFTRIYIPAVAKNQDNIESYIHDGVRPLIEQLFGENLVCMKQKDGVEYEDFNEGAEIVLVSTKDKKKEAVTA